MEQEKPTITPKMIVLHWTAIPTFEKSYDFFYDSRLNPKRKDIEDESALNVSAHYMVKRNGEIYQLLPDTLFARHVIGLNHAAIGIENVGTKNNRLTDAQLQANVHLIQELTERHNIEYLIGHYEYTLFEEHPLWKEKDDGYRTKKIDPGKEFMEKVRNQVADLNLKGPPERIR
ncbi:peptidoglycan recognition family protein [Fodinibius sp.]|uniref:N-acetylmuramoyl-L-alanine amidase n=1 Tax=Fodinibius sp. TaxID=1872440 RepID=UPI002ACEAAD1|nr:peptidoglycan recognition family protein [Fodinibius sp.]MDZ7658626.1 peptidoglycan recognition family protein [Fodinibius sp.]